MMIQSFGWATLLVFSLSLSNSAAAEEKTSPDIQLTQHTDQLYEALELAGQSNQELYALAKGMSDQITHMLYEYKTGSDLEIIRAAQNRVDSVDRVTNYLDRVHSSADKFLTAVSVYQFFRNQSDKQRVAPFLIKIRDGQANAMEGMLTALEQRVLPRVPISSVEMVRAAIRNYRAVQKLMLAMQF